MGREDRRRPIDLAREHGLSAEAIRKYEEAGILPHTPRGPQGYRHYSDIHARALRTFLALRRGFGHQVATEIMRAVNRGDHDATYWHIAKGQAAILDDHANLDELASGLRELAPPSSRDPRADRRPRPDPDQREAAPLSIGALARQIGVHPATLRTWEQLGIVKPDRDRTTGYRRFSAADARDAQLAQRLRLGGHLLAHIATVVAQVRDAGGVAPLEETIRTSRTRLHQRSRAMLDGCAELSDYLRHSESTP